MSFIIALFNNRLKWVGLKNLQLAYGTCIRLRVSEFVGWKTFVLFQSFGSLGFNGSSDFKLLFNFFDHIIPVNFLVLRHHDFFGVRNKDSNKILTNTKIDDALSFEMGHQERTEDETIFKVRFTLHRRCEKFSCSLSPNKQLMFRV